MDNQSKPRCGFWETVQNGFKKLSIQVVNHRYYCSYLSLEETNTDEKDSIGVSSTLKDYYKVEDRIVNPRR